MLDRWLPVLGWLRAYRREDLRGDLAAGVTVAAMLVPQSMGYAMLAGLPPVVGLYASTVPLVVYALFGSSRHLAVGPVAMVSLLVLSGASTVAEPGSAQYVSAVVLLAALVGLVQLLLGLLRFGFVVNFLSHAATSGFTSAAAVVICLSQLKHLLGVGFETGETAVATILAASRHMADTHLPTLGMGLAAIAFLAVARVRAPRLPAALLAMALGTALVWVLDGETAGIRTVGSVPSGLPPLSLPALDLPLAGRLAPTALVIAFLGYMESIAVAQLIAGKERYRVDPDAELRGLGLANLAAALFAGYPVTGGFSRTAVNHSAGARTGLAAAITAALVVATLLVLTPLFRHLPNTVLAAVIVVAVGGLIDVRAPRELLRLKRVDGCTLLVTFAATLLLGPEPGIGIGVGFSLLVFIWRSAHPHTAELGYVADERAFRNLARYPDAVVCAEVLVLRVDASLYFANMGFVEDRLRERLVERPAVRWIVLDLTGVNDVDAVALHRLAELVDDHGQRGVKFVLSGMKGPVRDLFDRARAVGVMPEVARQPGLEQALAYCTAADDPLRNAGDTP